MADRQRRKGIQHDHPHDPRNTRRPLLLAASAPDADDHHTDSAAADDIHNIHDIPTIYSASSEEDVLFQSNLSQHQRGRHASTTTTCRGSGSKHHVISSPHSHPSGSSLRNWEITRVRDSGYNTDVSPARTSSSTSTPAEHFSFSFDHPPERMTIREDSSSVGSPYSDGGYNMMYEYQPDDHHSDDLEHQHNSLFHPQQEQYHYNTGGDNESHFLHPPILTSSHHSSFVTTTTSTASSVTRSVELRLPELYEPRVVRHHSTSLKEKGNDKVKLAMHQQQQNHQRDGQSSLLSHSAPGSHGFVHDDFHTDSIQQSPSVPVGLFKEWRTTDDAEDDSLDAVDGRRKDDSSFSRRYEYASSPAEGLTIPILPKSMSNSFQDLQDGDDTEPEEEEEDDNDVMTSSEEIEMEEMVIDSKSRRYSLRKRHYSGGEEEECSGSPSSSIQNVAHRFPPGRDGIITGATDSAMSVQVPSSTSLPSLSRDYINQMSPQLASSIKNACRFMIGLHIGSSSEQDEEDEECRPNVSELMRRRSSLDKSLTHSSARAGLFLREEEELCVDTGRFNFDVSEDTQDSFDIDIDGIDSDEDVFTFDFEDIQEYNKSQESLERELGAYSQYRQQQQQQQQQQQHHHPQQHHHHRHSATTTDDHDYRDGQQQDCSSSTAWHNNNLSQHSAPATPRAPTAAALPPRIVLDRPPISPSSRTTNNRKSIKSGASGGPSSNKSSSTTALSPAPRQGGRPIPAHVQLAGGARLPWDECSAGLGGVLSSASTQTPHRASTMIDEMVTTPVALPSEARGTAFMHLRRGSVDMTTLMRNQPAPLPDIVPFARHRAQSAPNLHDVILRQRAQRTGRELRRLSDRFHENVVRRHSVHHEESHHQQSFSYPRMGPSYFLRERVRAFVFGTFRSRRGSSVDDETFPEVNDDDS